MSDAAVRYDLSRGSHLDVLADAPSLLRSRGSKPSEQGHARIAVRGFHADPLLERPHGSSRFVADSAVDAAGVVAERGETVLDLLHLGEGGRTLAPGKHCTKGRSAEHTVAQVEQRERVQLRTDCRISTA
jgi:hypothetical protein